MDQVNALQIIITVLGSGALFSFLQFLIQRKDNKDERKIQEQFESIEKKIDEGLAAGEKTSLERYNEHHETIKEMMCIHKDDFNSLLKTFNELKENGKRLEEKMEKIATNQENTCSALVGVVHDKIVHMTDKITERGAITLKERATLDSIYQPYRIMGGNSHAKAGYEHCIDLPVISDEESKRMDDEIKVRRREETKKNKQSNS